MRLVAHCLTVCLLLNGIARASDWATWRGDAARSGYIDETLSKKLKLHWTVALPKPLSAWPEQAKLEFDRGYEPIAVGNTLFLASNVDNSLAALYLDTGQTKWKYYTNGPIRFAPVSAQGRVMFVSDDGFLYCLDNLTGKLLWKHRGGPNGRKLLGNERLISAWPARGAPVVQGKHVYFAAGIWPFMGIFVHSVDIETGKTVWSNSGTGSNYLVQQHNSPAFAGVAPQGYLVATKKHLIVSGGRTVPAIFDRVSGKQLYFIPGSRTLGKNIGGFEVVVGPNWFANRGSLFRLSDGDPVGRCSDQLLSPPGSVIQLSKDKLLVSSNRLEVKIETYKDKRGRKKKRIKTKFADQSSRKLPGKLTRLHLVAGRLIYASDGKGKLFALRLGKKNAKIVWQHKFKVPLWRVIVANGSLVAVDLKNNVMGFGTGPIRHRPEKAKPAAKPLAIPAKPKLPEIRDVEIGSYALVLGAPQNNSPQLAELLNAESNFKVIIVDSDAAQLQRLRRSLSSEIGKRVDLIQADPTRFVTVMPKYFASIIYCTNTKHLDGFFAGGVFKSVRPYGGFIWVAKNGANSLSTKRYRELGATVSRNGANTFIEKKGPLVGAAPWTHQNADVANSMISADRLVKAPLGLLWFGGPTNREVLPRHGHGPTPQVIGGRLIIEGPNMLRALDVYTGRLLWQHEFPDLGRYYNNRGHQPGAGAIGSNYVSVSDGIYVAYGRKALRLHPRSGNTLATFRLAAKSSKKKSLRWGYIGVYEDKLIAGADPLAPISRSNIKLKKTAVKSKYAEGSKRLIVLNRYTGKKLWSRKATYNFRHNSIIAADSLVFCLDRMTEKRLDFLRRRGEVPKAPFVLYALDANTGKVVWRTSRNVFGTWLAYSREHGVLLQAGSKFRDRAPDESGEGMAVYAAQTGRRIWYSKLKYNGPPLLLGNRIITQGKAYELMTGKPIQRRDPLTGSAKTWSFTRNYGCNTVIGCTNLLTFRSAAAGYYDLAGDGGTGNFGGFRSSCTANLIPADGVLAAPEYTRTCLCSYQNQCSLALVHMPSAEMWTFNSSKWDGKRIKQLGLNFGAPGDRRDARGLLWLDYPSVGGKSPDPKIKISGDKVRYFRVHSGLMNGADKAWVGASGMIGATRIRIPVVGRKVKDKTRSKYTVRLYFALPPGSKTKEWRQSISLQGKPVLTDFTLARSGQTVTKEFRSVPIGRSLAIQLDGQATFLSGVSLKRE